MDYVPSASTIAKINAGITVGGFVLSYCFPDKQLSLIFTERKWKETDNDYKTARYFSTFVGQHDVPWMSMSLILAYSSAIVPKEFCNKSPGLDL